MGHDRLFQGDVGLHHLVVEEGDARRIEHRLRPAGAAIGLLVGKGHRFVEGVHAVALLQLAIPEHGGAAVDAALGQLGDEIVQLVHHRRVEVPAVRPAPIHDRILLRAGHQVPDPHQVEAVLGQPAGRVRRFLLVARRALHGGHQADRRAVLEDPAAVDGLHEPVLARRGVERTPTGRWASARTCPRTTSTGNHCDLVQRRPGRSAGTRARGCPWGRAAAPACPRP